MKIAHYEQMMDYLTGPRERFSNGGSVEGEKLIASLKNKKDKLGRPNISEYQEKLKILKEIQEKKYINPKTKKPFTPKEWLESTASYRSKFRDPKTFLKKKKEYMRKYMAEKKKDPKYKQKFLTKKKEDYYSSERKKPAFTKIQGGRGVLLEERNRLLAYMSTAAKNNPNYKEIIKDGKFLGVIDKQNGINYYEAGYKGKLGKNSKLITSHPSFETNKKLVDLARQFKTSLPNKAISSYFSSYARVPTLAEMQNFLQADPRFVSKMSPQYFKTNPLHLHHQISITESPTEKTSLLLQDRNDQAGKKMIEFKKGNITEKQLNSELKKLNTRYYLNNKPIGAKKTLPETQLKTAKTQVTKLFNKRLSENPKLIEEMTKILGIVGCPPGKAMGGRIGFQTGATPTAQCITRGVNKINTGNIKSVTDQRNFAKLLNTTGNLKNAVRVLSKIGVVGEGVWLGVETLGRSAIYGDTLSESFRKSADWLVPGNLTQDAQVDKINRVLKDKDLGAIYRKYDTYKDNLNKLKSLKASKEFDENILDDSSFSYTAVPEGRDAYLKRKEQEIEKQQNILDKSFVNPEQQLVARRAFNEAEDIAKSTALATRLKKFATDVGKQEDESGLNIDLDFIPRPEKIAPFGNFRDIASTKPEDLLKTFQDALRDGVYGNPGLESSVKKASEEYAEVRSGLENFKKMSLAEFVQSGVASDDEVFGTQGANVLKKINQPVPFKRKSSYFQSPLELQEQNKLIEEGGMLGAAGGGLLKQAGDRSGKPPEAGPTPQGLDFLIKRGRQS